MLPRTEPGGMCACLSAWWVGLYLQAVVSHQHEVCRHLVFYRGHESIYSVALTSGIRVHLSPI